MSGNEDCFSLTAEESEIYDRQIRLWGVEAQRQLSSSKVLICALSGAVQLLNELVKNLVLAGVGKVEIATSPGYLNSTCKRTGTPSDPDTNVIGSGAFTWDALLLDWRDMNPLIRVNWAPRIAALLDQSPEQVEAMKYSIVCIVGCDSELNGQRLPTDHGDLTCVRIARLFSSLNVPVLVGDTAGLCGGLYVDHPGDPPRPLRVVDRPVEPGPQVKRKRSNAGEPQNLNLLDGISLKSSSYARVSGAAWDVIRNPDAVLRLDTKNDRDFILWMALRLNRSLMKLTSLASLTKRSFDCSFKEHVLALMSAAQALPTDLAPVATVLGGLWSAEVVKIASKATDATVLNNFLFYDACASSGTVTFIREKI